ncbi:alanine racemase [Brucepastera parasyntrophica]|uniref:alanine racemase n=1 Tax=Brucepastera parasyntrophica TaxID=2880008 RepID=UPI00210932F6|nr:alanine racemase [Brucepastera parasyntrophica]ULQ59725.1 alanine racemase [Brucepastera parasyntrophica]
MAYIEIDPDPILYNIRKFRDLAGQSGLSLTAVTKFCTSDPEILQILEKEGITSVADSNMPNFLALPPELAGKFSKSLIKTRLSDIRALPDIPEYLWPDRLFVSDEKLLAAAALLPSGRKPGIMLIVEVGDLKEGFYPDQLPDIIARFKTLPIEGVSANFACLSGKMPDAKSLEILKQCAALIPGNPDISVGGTVVYQLLAEGRLSAPVSEIRIGEGIFFGHDSSSGGYLPGFRTGAFTLYGEIIEIREKEITGPDGGGHTALGGLRQPRKTGKRLCAVLDFGVLAASSGDIVPVDPAVEIAGQTFDFTVADITDSQRKYAAGEYVGFTADYAAASQALLNTYITRIILKE